MPLVQTTKYDNGAVKLTVSCECGTLDGWLGEKETIDAAVERIEQSLEDAQVIPELAPQVVEVKFYENGKEIKELPNLAEAVTE